MRVIVALTLSIWGLGSQAQYNPKAQAKAHASAWTVWNVHNRIQNDCDFLLEQPAEMNLYRATDILLEQLVGDQMPEESPTSLPSLVTWDSVDKLSVSRRQSLAAHIYQMHSGFRDNKSKQFSFGHVIYGKENIERYIKAVTKIYEDSLTAMQAAQGYTWRNRIANLKAVTKIAAWFGINVYLMDFTQQYGPLAFVGTMAATAVPLLFPITVRLASYISGDERYQKQFAEAYVSRGQLSEIVSRTETAINTDNSSSFYAEAPFHILTSAFNALRKDADDAAQEMARSCRIHSPQTRCDEYVAFHDAYRMDKYGLAGAITTIRDTAAAGQKNIALPGTIAHAFFRDPNTGEPILVSWLRIQLSPVDDGKKKPKEQTQIQTQDSWGWGGLSPVPARAR